MLLLITTRRARVRITRYFITLTNDLRRVLTGVNAPLAKQTFGRKLLGAAQLSDHE